MPGSCQEDYVGLSVAARRVATDGHAGNRIAIGSMFDIPAFVAARMPESGGPMKSPGNYGVNLMPERTQAGNCEAPGLSLANWREQWICVRKLASPAGAAC